MRTEKEDDLWLSHRASLEHQEDLPPEHKEKDPAERRGERGAGKAGRMEAERPRERVEGITAERRGSRPAPSDRPENDPPHPQDVNEIGEAR